MKVNRYFLKEDKKMANRGIYRGNLSYVGGKVFLITDNHGISNKDKYET